MSDLEILLEEIDAYKGMISSAIYLAKIKGNLGALGEIVTALQEALDGICVNCPELFKKI